MSPLLTETQRVLALSLRASRFGYAMFEGTNLLDYGICSCMTKAETVTAVAARRIDHLLRILRPARIVIRQQSRPHLRFRPDSQLILRSVQHAARVHGIDLEHILYTDVQTIFAPFRAKTKHDVASEVARLFPELLPKLPPTRKTWQPEREVMVLFDAVAVGIVHIEKRRGKLLPFF